MSVCAIVLLLRGIKQILDNLTSRTRAMVITIMHLIHGICQRTRVVEESATKSRSGRSTGKCAKVNPYSRSKCNNNDTNNSGRRI